MAVGIQDQGCVGAEKDRRDHHRRAAAAQRLEHVQTHGGWERRDEHDGVGLVQVDQGQHFDTVLGHEHRVTAVFEDLYHARPSVVVLGDDQDSLLVGLGLGFGLGIGIGVGVDHGSSWSGCCSWLKSDAADHVYAKTLRAWRLRGISRTPTPCLESTRSSPRATVRQPPSRLAVVRT